MEGVVRAGGRGEGTDLTESHECAASHTCELKRKNCNLHFSS